MKNTTNVFLKGMTSDMHPLTTSQLEYTDALNATLITFNGNEQMMQNDMGNTLIQDSKTGNIMGLREGFVPVGLKEHGGIMYIASVNKDGVGEIGTIPSPIIKYFIGDDTLNAQNEVLVKDNLITEYLIPISDTKLSPGEKFMVQLGLDCDLTIESFTNVTFGQTNIIYPLVSMIDHKGIYNINLYSVTDHNNYLLNSLTNTTQKYYLIGDLIQKESDYWFINGTDTLNFDSVKCSRNVEFDGSTCMRSYPGDVPAGRLAIKAKYEELESFALIKRADNFAVPYTWAKYTRDSLNNPIEVNYYSYLSDFIYKTLSGIHIGKIVISATNSEGNMNLYNCEDSTSYGSSATFNISIPNNSEISINRYTDNNEKIYFTEIEDLEDLYLAKLNSLNNLLFDLINTDQSNIDIRTGSCEDIETHVLSKYIKCLNNLGRNRAIFPKDENSELSSSQEIDATRYGICYLDLGNKLNQWINVKVDYYDQCDNKLGTYELVFNPYINDTLHEVYNANLIASSSINQYYDCLASDLTQEIKVIPDNRIISLNDKFGGGPGETLNWKLSSAVDNEYMTNYENVSDLETLDIYTNASFIDENNSDLKYLYDNANPKIAIDVSYSNDVGGYYTGKGPWIKYMDISSLGSLYPRDFCYSGHIEDVTTSIILRTSSLTKDEYQEEPEFVKLYDRGCEQGEGYVSETVSYQMVNKNNLIPTFLNPGISKYFYNSLLGIKYSASFHFYATPLIDIGTTWTCGGVSIGACDSITVSSNESDTLPNQSEHKVIPYYELIKVTLDPSEQLRKISGGLIYINGSWSVQDSDIDISANYLVSTNIEDMGSLYIMEGLDTIDTEDEDYPNNSGSIIEDKSAYKPLSEEEYSISGLSIQLHKGAYMFNINYANNNERPIKLKVYDLELLSEYELHCPLYNDLFIPNVLIFPHDVIITKMIFLERTYSEELVKGIFYNSGLYEIPNFDLINYSEPSIKRYVDSDGNYLCIPKSYFIFLEENIKCLNKTYNYSARAPYAYGTHLIGSVLYTLLSPEPIFKIDKLIYTPDNSDYSKTIINSDALPILENIGIINPSSIITYRES